MPAGRRPKGPRLYLRERAGRDPQWVIRDGRHEAGTGCGAEDSPGAQRALARYLAERHAPPTGVRELARLMVADVINLYLKERAPHVARPDFLATTATPVLGWWGTRTLADIKGQTCREYVTWRTAQGVSEATARHDLKTLRAAINHYHAEHGPLPALPAVTMPPVPEPRDRWLTRSEVARLLDAARRLPKAKHLARMILIGLYTGTRSGAVLRLRWLPSTDAGWIDLERGVLHRRGRGERVSSKRQPPVRLPDRLLAHLRRWHAADTALGITHVVHWQGEPIIKLRRSWESARKQAGLGPEVVPHTLRHTAATWLMQSEVSIAEAAGFLGMTAATLEQVYGHHHPAFQERAATAIGRH